MPQNRPAFEGLEARLLLSTNNPGLPYIFDVVNQPLASVSTVEIQGAVWNDLNPDGIGDTDEPELAISTVFDPSLLIGGQAVENLTAPAAASFPLEDTFLLHSNPSASKTIYLDFDGHVTSGTEWNQVFTNNEDIITPVYSFEGDSSFSDVELARIQYIWERVVEDYLPFEVDVTTEDPGVAALIKSGGGDTEWGTRVVIGGSSYDWVGVGAGGIAYLDSFTWNTDTPCFVFPEQLGDGHEKSIAEAASHEAGHTLDLYHDGTSDVAYYEGHGSGPTGWAPIMGAGYYRELVQWSKGEYTDADNSEDDLSIIVTGNGFGYRPDDHGDTRGTASFLDVTGIAVSDEGIIEQNTDLDYFSFTTGDGPISLNIDPFYRSPNLDILASLYDASGGLIATSNPIGALDASFSLTLASGTYFISVDGIGEGAPASGYSDYSSLGYYSITGTIIISGRGDDRAIAESTVYGTKTAGDLTSTYASDNSYEAITEEKYGGKRSRLEHQWTFNVIGGKTVTFFVEAYHDSTVEDFLFEYSTDGVTWTPMLTVIKTADDDVAQSFELPVTTSEMVFVRVVDTNRSQHENTLDSLYVDDMWIRSDVGGEIHGSVWNDLNEDGIRDAGEAGLVGWTVFFDDDNDGTLDTGEINVATDANGDYAFLSVAQGDYTVAEVMQSGWYQTFPAGDGTHMMTLVPGQIANNIDFGNQLFPGDANRDGVVSADDFASVQDNFGDTGVPGIPGDATGDGTVSSDDYGSVQTNFGNVAGMSGMAAGFETTGLGELNNAYVGNFTNSDTLAEESTTSNEFTATTIGGSINITSTEPFIGLVVNVGWNSTPNQIAKDTWFYTPAMVTNRSNVSITPGAPGYFTTTLYYSTDDGPVTAAEGMEASRFTTANMWYLAPGQTHTVYLWAHADEDPGTYNLRVLTDVFDSVLETDETNDWSTLLSDDIV